MKMIKKLMFNVCIVCVFLLCLMMQGCSSAVDDSTENKAEEGKEESTEEKEIIWNMVWNDEFDGNTLDLSKWSYQIGNNYNGWGNFEAQYYTENNVSVSDGMLIIEARKEGIEGFEYTSGRIRTVNDDGDTLFSTKYGRIEARISLPVGQGLWPAFWMMPVDNEYGLWPLSGEIDIVEARGRIENVINGTIHYGERIPNNKHSGSDYTFEDSNISEFHVYAVEWDTNEIKWFVDGEEYCSTSNWYTMSEDGNIGEYPAPFNQEFYLILNLAVGGTYDDGILPNDSDLPGKMMVDYVRVYENADGYSDVSLEDKWQEMDTDAFSQLPDTDNFIEDTNFDSINTTPIMSTPDYVDNKWYFITKTYFHGNANGEVVDINGNKYFMCNIFSPGTKRYAVQLQHTVPLIKGYTYTLRFDAMADNDRQISMQSLGTVDGELTSYSETVYFDINNEMKNYYCSFTMESDTDLMGILEFNLGLEYGDVYIGNISIDILQNY